MDPFSLDHAHDASPEERQVTYGPAFVAVLAAATAALLMYSTAQPPSPAGDAPASHARCLMAQEDLRNLEWGGRVFFVDEDGVRRHAGAEERPVAIERARA